MPTLIFKETEACNSNCIYCDVIARKKPRTIKKKTYQSFGLNNKDKSDT